jgi:hypothetical protein
MKAQYLACIALFGLLGGCSQQAAITPVTLAQSQHSTDKLVPIVKPKDELIPVKPIGTFMNVKTDGEHASGYTIKLWKQDDKVYGSISVHRGLMGDPPTGILENVKFEPQTKVLSFTAKLSVGQFFDENHNNVPSQNRFEFKGTLTNKKLQGNLRMTNELCSNKCPKTRQINLPRSKEWSSAMKDYQSYAEWETFVNKFL